MADRKPTSASVGKDHLPIAFAMLFCAYETALTHIAEKSGDNDWHRDLYERTQKQLDEFNSLLTAASQIERDNIPHFQKDMPGAVRAGSAAVDAAFDAVIAKMIGGADGNRTI